MPEKAVMLVAEDLEDDVLLLHHAFQKAGLEHHLMHVSHGKECMNYLEGAPPYDDRVRYPFPNLLLLDLKMPIASGFDVLLWLRTKPQFSMLPVIILSDSDSPPDRERSLQAGAADYQIKPMALDDLVKIMEALDSRWLTRP